MREQRFVPAQANRRFQHDVATSFPLVEFSSVKAVSQQQVAAQRPPAPPAASIGARSANHVSSQQAKSLLHDVATSFPLVEHPRVIPHRQQHGVDQRPCKARCSTNSCWAFGEQTSRKATSIHRQVGNRSYVPSTTRSHIHMHHRRLRSALAPPPTSPPSRLKAYSTTWRRAFSLSNSPVRSRGADSTTRQSVRAERGVQRIDAGDSGTRPVVQPRRFTDRLKTDRTPSSTTPPGVRVLHRRSSRTCGSVLKVRQPSTVLNQVASNHHSHNKR